jgi:integrase
MLYSEHNCAAPVPFHLLALEPFWGDKTLADVNAKTCKAYVASRKVKPATARRELETLNAAIRYCAKVEGTPIVLIEFPDKAEPRDRWLTRKEVADLLRAARRQRNRHLCWFILMCLYTGTRSGAVLKMQWEPSVSGGYVDMAGGLIFRRGTAQKETRKRQPPARIPDKLLGHLRRWRKVQDRQWAKRVEKAKGKPLPPRCMNIIQYGNKPLQKERRAWARARDAAGLEKEVTPHILRHTCATWIMASGKVPIWEAAGFLGMSPKMLEEVYGKRHPDFQKNAANAF